MFAEEEGRNIAKALGAKSKVGDGIPLQSGIKYWKTDAYQGAILMNHGLLTVGSTVDEAGFLFGLLDRGCAMQLEVEAAQAGNPALKRNIISDEEAAYNFKMASDKHSLYRDAQPDLEFEIEMAGGTEFVARGVEDMRIDV